MSGCTRSYSSYSHGGCRCADCRAASAAYKRTRRALAAGVELVHRCVLCDARFATAQGVTVHETRVHR